MRISEIFKSIQGEGRNQGRPCIFVRFAGCNLHCSWCDTEYARTGGKEMSVPAIMQEITRFTGIHICITGGEPLMQGDELELLLEPLYAAGKKIEIETNGTIDFRPFQQYASICMDVKCPSSGESSDLSLLAFIRDEDSVKFVVCDFADCVFAEGVIREYQISGEIFLSPVEGCKYSEIVRFIQEHDLQVRFQVQLHKIIGVR